MNPRARPALICVLLTTLATANAHGVATRITPRSNETSAAPRSPSWSSKGGVLLLQTGSDPDTTDWASFQSVLTAVGADYVNVTTQDYNASLLAGYDTVIANINGGTLYAADLQALADFADAGGRVVVLGGSNSATFFAALWGGW